MIFQVILNRKDGLLNFTLDWNDYESGFGNFLGDYWIGEHSSLCHWLSYLAIFARLSA